VQLAGPIVVVSPHSDDGVLSLGAAMARWARTGAHVELLTVLALEPASTTPTEGWDRRAGFATEGDAARARREEDRRACAVLGVTPHWLPYGSVDFDRHGDDEEIRDAVHGCVEGGADIGRGGGAHARKLLGDAPPSRCACEPWRRGSSDGSDQAGRPERERDPRA